MVFLFCFAEAQKELLYEGHSLRKKFNLRTFNHEPKAIVFHCFWANNP